MRPDSAHAGLNLSTPVERDERFFINLRDVQGVCLGDGLKSRLINPSEPQKAKSPRRPDELYGQRGLSQEPASSVASKRRLHGGGSDAVRRLRKDPSFPSRLPRAPKRAAIASCRDPRRTPSICRSRLSLGGTAR